MENKLTDKEIEEVIEEYKSALIEKNLAKRSVENAQIKLQKAQKRVSLAFGEVQALRLR